MAPRKKKLVYKVPAPEEHTLLLRDAGLALTYRAEPEDEAGAMRATTRLSGKNQITLPVGMTRMLGWRAGDEVDLMIDGEEIWLRRRLQGKQLLDRLEGALSHVPEWQTDEGIEAWVRGERDSWDREWDSNAKPSTSGSAG